MPPVPCRTKMTHFWVFFRWKGGGGGFHFKNYLIDYQHINFSRPLSSGNHPPFHYSHITGQAIACGKANGKPKHIYILLNNIFYVTHSPL
jgi:hypothetical protein